MVAFSEEIARAEDAVERHTDDVAGDGDASRSRTASGRDSLVVVFRRFGGPASGADVRASCGAS